MADKRNVREYEKAAKPIPRAKITSAPIGILEHQPYRDGQNATNMIPMSGTAMYSTGKPLIFAFLSTPLRPVALSSSRLPLLSLCVCVCGSGFAHGCAGHG